MRTSIVCLLALFLAACGTEVKTLGQKTKEDIPVKGCPAGKPDEPFHEVLIYLADPPPAKMSLVLEGEEKLNECKAVEARPPIVTAERFNGNVLGILVQHFGAYPNLPATVSFKVMNLGNCSGTPTEFLSADRIPLAFETTYPHGPKCAARTVARVKLIKQ